MQTYTLTEEDRDLAEFFEDSMRGSVFGYPPSMIRHMAEENLKLFFRVIAPKYGFDPTTAKFAGDREHPSWDVLAEPINAGE